MVEQNARVICVPPPDKFGERNGDAGIGKKKLIGKMIRNKKKKEKERSSSYLHTVTAKMLSLYYLSLLSSILVLGLVLKDIRKKKKKKIGAYAPSMLQDLQTVFHFNQTKLPTIRFHW